MRVGTSGIGFIGDSRTRDHPHACGDKLTLTEIALKYLGSSPCVWGQASFWLFFLALCGIIPMRVGTRSALHMYPRCPRDHPHACGDKF